MHDVEDEFEELGQEGEQALFEHHRFVVDKGQQSLRLDKFVLLKLSGTSRNRIQNACDAGFILVNGKVSKSSYKVKPQDEVTIVLATPPRATEVVAENIPIEILYEDEYIAIVNKKRGMVVHPGFGNYSGTLVNALAWHFDHLPTNKTKLNNDQYLERPGLVHRIDKHTSGILIIAKTELAMIKLAKDFFDRTIDRRYVALCWGDPGESGTITGNIGRDLKDRKLRAVLPADNPTGKHAVTHFKMLKRIGYLSMVECKLETGRTHQIRVHFKHIGHPLFADFEYGGDVVLKGVNTGSYRQFVQNCFELISGQALHARSLTITHPITGEKMAFEAPIPEDMQTIIDRFNAFMAAKSTT